MEKQVELINSECWSIRSCRDTKDIVLSSDFKVVKEIEATKHHKRIIKYRVPIDSYVVKAYFSNSGRLYLKLKYPERVPEETWKTIVNVVRSYLGVFEYQ